MNNPERVLVACPTYQGKAYALDAYIKAYNDFTWAARGLFMVDTTGRGLRYFEHLKSVGVDCDHVQPTTKWQETFARAWKRITQKAVDENYDWVASIEADNICPPLTLDTLLNVAGYCRSAHVAHGYRWHSNQSNDGQQLLGLGCNLILTDLLKEVFAKDVWMTDAFESEIYEHPRVNNVPIVQVFNLLDIQHLDGPPGHEFYSFDVGKLPTMTEGRTTEGKPVEHVNMPSPVA